MTTNDILELVRAGFTKEEIFTLAGAQPAPEQKQPEQKPEEKQPEQKQPEEKQPKQKQPEEKQPEQKQPAPQQYDMLGQILEKLDQTAEQMRDLAIKQSQQPPKETADDILAAIIRPPQKKE